MKVAIVNPHIFGRSKFGASYLREMLCNTIPSSIPVEFGKDIARVPGIIEKLKPDVVINNSIFGFNFPKCFTITINHDPYVDMERLLGKDDFYKSVIIKQKNSLKAADVRIAVSNYIADMYKDCGEFRVIPTGVNSDVFKPMNKKKELREKYGIPLNCKVGIFVGSHHPTKGFWALVKEIASRPDIYWILVLTCCNLHYKQSPKNVKVIYPRVSKETLAELYNCSDFLISKSVVESLHLVCIEAMFCGIPVRHNKTGVFWDWRPPMNNPRKEALDKGLDLKTVLSQWKKLLSEVENNLTITK